MRIKKSEVNSKEKFILILGTSLFIFAFLISGLNNSLEYSIVGFMVIGLLLMYSFYILFLNIVKKKYIFKKESSIFLLSIIFIIVYFNGIFFEVSFDSVIMFLKVMMLIFFFLGATYFPLNKVNENTICIVISGFLLFHIIWWTILGFPPSFKGAMDNANSFGGFLVFVIGIMLIFSKFNSNKSFLVITFTTLTGLLLLLASGSRTTLLVSFTVFVTYYLWPIFMKKKLLFNAYFIFITGLIFVFTYIYPKLSTWPLGKDINNFSYKYTGKTFFSGRQYIWGDIISVIEEKVFWGYGSAAMPSELLLNDLSAHNFYLQTALQVGFLGITIFLLLILSIWNYLYLAKHSRKVRIIGSLFLGVLVFLVFEVSLTQNNLAIGLLQWLIIGLGVNYTRNDLLSKDKLTL